MYFLWNNKGKIALNGQMLNFINYYQSNLKELRINQVKKLKINIEKEVITSRRVEMDSWNTLLVIEPAK